MAQAWWVFGSSRFDVAEAQLLTELLHQINGEMLPFDGYDEMTDLVSIPATGQVIAVGVTQRNPEECSNTFNYTIPAGGAAIFVYRASASLTTQE